MLNGVLLLVSLFKIPDSYYLFIQWAASAACLYGAWVAYQAGDRVWSLSLVMASIFSNPQVPLPFTRPEWGFFHFLEACLLIIAAITFGTSPSKPGELNGVT